MGWSSGTRVFDTIASNIFASKLSDEVKHDIMLIVTMALEEEDWDCESDSAYWEHPIVRKVMMKLNPDWDWKE